MSKPLVIYHADCADGFGAAFAAWTKLGDAAEYVPMKYGQEIMPTQIADNREVYILDFSFPRQIMEGLFSIAKRVVWLDHHASVFKDWSVPLNAVADEVILGLVQPNEHHILLDNSKSGAYLAWEYFHPGEDIPLLIRHIDDYDRWVFANPDTKSFNKALWSYAPWDFDQWLDMFFNDSGRPILAGSDTYMDLYIEGEAILRAHDQNVQSVVENAVMECEVAKTVVDKHDPNLWKVTMYAESYKGLAANCPPHLSSDVGHELATRSGTFGLCWSMEDNKRVKCSLRSNGDYDVSAIAKTFGGGGHLNAASFHTDIETLMGWLR